MPARARAIQNPQIDIILPTFNRARFLSEAFEAIRSQSISEWRLIVIDDGSTDETASVVTEFSKKVGQEVEYHFHENQGAYASRNLGLECVKSKYVAFYDSDDLWLPHHLEDCQYSLDAYPEIDWVYGALRRIEAGSKKVLEPSNLDGNGTASRVRDLQTVQCGHALRIIDSRIAQYAIEFGIGGGLHSSLIRKSVFDHYRFDGSYRNGQDRFALIEAILNGHGIAYINNCHVDYRVHDSNDSMARNERNTSHLTKVYEQLCSQYCDLASDTRLDANSRMGLKRRIGNLYFWSLGYNGYYQSSDFRKTRACLWKGLKYSPFSLAKWKTSFAIALRTKFRGFP